MTSNSFIVGSQSTYFVLGKGATFFDTYEVVEVLDISDFGICALGTKYWCARLIVLAVIYLYINVWREIGDKRARGTRDHQEGTEDRVGGND